MSNTLAQPGILNPTPTYGASLSFRPQAGGNVRRALARLQQDFDPAWGVIGLGEPLVAALGQSIPGLHSFTALSGQGCGAPATQHALAALISGADRSEVFNRIETLKVLLADDFELEDAEDTFLYAGGRDLTGYEDGTENPEDEEAESAALADGGPGFKGSSFVAIQRWEHDLERFNAHPPATRNAMIGRDRDSNEELEEAPPSAHVKRSAQEDFDPAAFMLRRSMAWSTGKARGLEFVAYGHSLQPFEQVLRRMMGLDDGIVDALFDFSRPVTGGYYWCPPLKAGHLDLSQLGL